MQARREVLGVFTFGGLLFAEGKKQSRVLRGRVTDGNGSSIRNAAVTLKRSNAEDQRCYFTGLKGTFRFEGLSFGQEYELQASYAGRSSRVTPIRCCEDKLAVDVTLVIPSTG